MVLQVLTRLNNDIQPRKAELVWLWSAVGGEEKARGGLSRPQLRLLVTIWYFHVEPMTIPARTGCKTPPVLPCAFRCLRG